MFYVGAYEEDDGECKFVGWGVDKFAVEMYNVAGHKSGAFYDHYSVYEYNCKNEEEFTQIVTKEWIDDITSKDFYENYISIYETQWGDWLSLSVHEYNELIRYTDVDYEMAINSMRILYEFIKSSKQKVIRKRSIVTFIGFLAARYMDILRGSKHDTTKISKNIDKIQAFISLHGEIFYLS